MKSPGKFNMDNEYWTLSSEAKDTPLFTAPKDGIYRCRCSVELSAKKFQADFRVDDKLNQRYYLTSLEQNISFSCVIFLSKGQNLRIVMTPTNSWKFTIYFAK